MFEPLSGIWSLLTHINIINVIDILIVSYIVYKLFMLIRETRAETLIKGLVMVVVVMGASYFIGLKTLYWIIKNAFQIGLIALVILFQPELRRALEHLGRSKLFTNPITITDEEVDKLTSHIVDAAINLSSTKTGALIVIEQETGLNDYIESGIRLDSELSSQLLENIFVVNTPLHDGAVIIRNNRIAAAACFLPLTEKYDFNKKLGTRHRAALGISENSDAIVVVVSEETGSISLAINGRLTRNYNAERLRDILSRVMKQKLNNKTTVWERVKSWAGQK